MVESHQSAPGVIAKAIAEASPHAKWVRKQAGQPEPEPLENPLHKIAKQMTAAASQVGRSPEPPPETTDGE